LSRATDTSVTGTPAIGTVPLATAADIGPDPAMMVTLVFKPAAL
jgi:hypothetical protein